MDWDWWNISVFGIIPLISVIVLFVVKRKLLWMAPLISTVISVTFSVLTLPSLLEVNEYRNIFFGISIPIHFVITVLLTLIAYVVAYVQKRKRGIL